MIDAVVAPVLHSKVPVVPVAFKTELPQLLVTPTVGVTGIAFTVNAAPSELAVPALLLHTARYCLPLSAIVVANVYVALVAPVIFDHVVPLPDCHCTVGEGVPLAADVKLAFVPAHLVCATGWVVTFGDTVTPPGLTVTTTSWLFTHPAAVNVYA